MRTAIAATLAALSIAGLTGCDSRAEPGAEFMLLHRVDAGRERSWWLMRDGVVLNSAAQPKRVVALPGWLWALEPLCPPDLALGPDGEAVVTSNVVSVLWRVDPKTLAVSMHELKLDSDTDKDVGLVAITYAAEHGSFFAYSESPRALWKIDRELTRGTKVNSEESVDEKRLHCSSNYLRRERRLG
jgi:hypothetical protein